jgi:hypothetical protein
MNEDFIFRLGADVSSFTKSITEVEAELTQARKAVKGALGDDLIKANQYVQDLEQTLKDLKSVGVQVPGAAKAATELKNIAPAAQKAQNTLTGLSGVVRDLPFGFIAIQNNLPILADQFTSLSKESGGVGGALKNLGGALIGPAGIAFAFGAVTSIVTGLIQKYGSLGEAVNVLLGITKPLTEAQKAYNKASFETAGNVAAEEAKVKILTSTLLDNKKPQADRLAAYGELKKVAPDVVSGIKDENALTSESNALIEANSRLRAESVRLKVQEAGITAALTSNATKLAETNDKLALAQADVDVATKKYNNSQNNQSVAARTAEQGINTYALSLEQAKKKVTEIEAEIKSLTTEQNRYIGQLTPIINGLSLINEENRKRIAGLKAEAKEEKATAKESKNAVSKKIREQKRLTAEASKEVQERIKRQDYVNKKSLEDQRRDFTERRKIERKEGINIPKTISGEVTPFINIEAINRKAQEASEIFAGIKRDANLDAAFNLINDTFFSPLQNLFSDLISGADGAFKAFTKAVLQSINQIVAKIIATGIISLLFNLISGGTAGLGKAVLGDIGKALGFAFGGIANPNFGGVTGGGMAMSGAVNVVLRGQDLVGSLNRTNAQINRVG